jgi:hypothetical protein
MTSTGRVLNDIAVGGCSLSAVGLIDAVLGRGITWHKQHCRLPETVAHKLQVNTLVPKLIIHNK